MMLSPREMLQLLSNFRALLSSMAKINLNSNNNNQFEALLPSGFCLKSSFSLFESAISNLKNSGSDEDLQQLMDQRRKKRMISNRESARRFRKRKQKHLDDLKSQLNQLRNENNQIISSVSITTQHYISVEAENSVLRAQAAELSHRLQSLNEMIAFMYQPVDTGCRFEDEQYGSGGGTEFVDEFMNNSLSYLYANQPIMASADMIQY
uniref:BZIP domain-containing protein n=1 Tax=Lactuca sativa TaxID=4236 RepID=A0A9R1VQ59_LACSA|nr:hypothetical protein LSAT_V11C400205040 [Lactuca sativa]